MLRYLSLIGWDTMILHVLLVYQFVPNVHDNLIFNCPGESSEIDDVSIGNEIFHPFAFPLQKMDNRYISKLESISLLELIDIFFRYFVEVFDIFKSVITLRGQGQVIEKPNWEISSVLWRLSIEDPLFNTDSSHPYDLGSTLSRTTQINIFKIMRRAIYAINAIAKSDSRHHSFHIQKFFSKPDLLGLAKHSNYQGSVPIVVPNFNAATNLNSTLLNTFIYETNNKNNNDNSKMMTMDELNSLLTCNYSYDRMWYRIFSKDTKESNNSIKNNINKENENLSLKGLNITRPSHQFNHPLPSSIDETSVTPITPYYQTNVVNNNYNNMFTNQMPPIGYYVYPPPVFIYGNPANTYQVYNQPDYVNYNYPNQYLNSSYQQQQIVYTNTNMNIDSKSNDLKINNNNTNNNSSVRDNL